MEVQDSDVSATNVPEGFSFSAVACGIKYENRLDLGLIFSERECSGWGVFTKNSVKAAPVLLGKKLLKFEKFRGILVNSGNANACTGKEGLKRAELLLKEICKELKVKEHSILPASTGVIGVQLPVDSILPKFKELVKNLSKNRVLDFAKAIMTTDTFPKVVAEEVDGVKVLGIAKGAGMIAPNMATMLGFLLTDGILTKEQCKKFLAKVVEESFNRITVDGDTSTNDTVYLLSSNVKEVKDYSKFYRVLSSVAKKLAFMIVKDGEGATKVVRIKVKGAKTKGEAKEIAFAVANSPLVKTAFYGNDPNWGRIFAAMGKTGVKFSPEKVELYLNDIPWVVAYELRSKEEVLSREMSKSEVTLLIKLKEGKQGFEVLTSDLTEDYIKINAEYRT